jgi:hypothetical protein
LMVACIVGASIMIKSCVDAVLSNPEKLGESIGGFVDKVNHGYEKATTDKTD